jgi:hypothetical protein
MKLGFKNNKNPSPKKSKSVLLLISPKYLGVFSIILAIGMLSYPKASYEKLMLEPNYLFLNIQVFLFLHTCIIGFLLGVFFVKGIHKNPKSKANIHLSLINLLYFRYSY